MKLARLVRLFGHWCEAAPRGLYERVEAKHAAKSQERDQKIEQITERLAALEIEAEVTSAWTSRQRRAE